MEKVISRTIPTKVVYQIMTVSPTDGIKMGDLVEWDHEIIASNILNVSRETCLRH